MRWIVWSAGWFLVMPVAGTACLASPQQEKTNVSGFRSLSLTLSTASNTIALSQALHVIVRLTNPTQADVCATCPLSLEAGFLKLYVCREGDTFKKYRHVGCDTVCAWNKEQTFKPGEVVAVQVVVSEWEDGGEAPVFLRTGKYRIKVELSNGSGGQETISSEEMTVVVRDLVGKEVLAESYLREKHLVGILGADAGYGTEKAIPSMREFLMTYSDTIYAPQVRLALAIILRNGLPTSWRGDPPEVKQRLSDTWAVLEESFSHCPPEILPDVLYLAIETKCFQGDRAKAGELLSAFKEKCSWHPRYAELEDLKESVERIKPEKDK